MQNVNNSFCTVKFKNQLPVLLVNDVCIQMHSENTIGTLFIAAQRGVRNRVKHHNKKGLLSRSFAYFALNLETDKEYFWFTGSQEVHLRTRIQEMTPYDVVHLPSYTNVEFPNHTSTPFINLWKMVCKTQSHLLSFHFKSDVAVERITRDTLLMSLAFKNVLM